MDSQRIQSLVMGNLLPIGLGIIGVVLLLLGIAQILFSKNEAPEIILEKSNPEPSKIVVDVEGAVIKPGVYSIPGESRIVDALAAAGGLSEHANRDWVEKNINLAKKATDGLKIYIPRNGEQVLSSSGSDSLGTTGPVMNINTASASDLDTLPGVGSATSQKIIEGRPYATIDELITKKVVGQATFEKIKEKISAN